MYKILINLFTWNISQALDFHIQSQIGYPEILALTFFFFFFPKQGLQHYFSLGHGNEQERISQNHIKVMKEEPWLVNNFW